MKKRKYAIISFAFWSPKVAAKPLQTTLEATRNQELNIHFFHLREVGPSRKILHARGVGSERRKRVERKDGSWVALGTTRKIKIPSLISYFCRSRDRLFWQPVCDLEGSDGSL